MATLMTVESRSGMEQDKAKCPESRIVAAFERVSKAGLLVLGYIAVVAVPITALLMVGWGARKLWLWLV